jgi:uncharacterized membrane protein YfcA
MPIVHQIKSHPIVQLGIFAFTAFVVYVFLHWNGQYHASALLGSTIELVTLLKLILIGICAGILSGLTGLGGGIIIVPMIILCFGSNALIDAVIISFYAVFFNSISATRSKRNLLIEAGAAELVDGEWKHTGKEDFKKIILLAMYYLIGIIVGCSVIAYIFGAHKELVSKNLIAIFQLILAVSMLIPLTLWKNWFGSAVIKNPWLDIGFGWFIGCFSTMIGVGGGTSTMLYFNITKQIDLIKCSCISNFVGIFVGAMSIIGYLGSSKLSDDVHHPLFNWYEIAALVIAGIIGAAYGVKIQSRFDVKNIKRVIAIFLANSAFFIFFKNSF